MPGTTYSSFDGNTEALEVAKAFANSVRGKNILVTGVNRGGVGWTTAQAFASQAPANLIIAGRSQAKLNESIDALRAEYPDVSYRPLILDLSSQKAVRAAASEFLSWSDISTLDIIVNSAGIMCIPERTLSEDGIEIQFATNHIGHFLFTSLIMPKLIKSSKSNSNSGATRVVNVSSASPTWTQLRWSDLNFEKKNKDIPENERPNYQVHKMWGQNGDLDEKSYLPLEGYNQSKVANLLFAIALTDKLYSKHGILSIAIHPGVIFSELGRAFDQETTGAVQALLSSGTVPIKSLGAGAATSIVAALDPKLGPGEMKDGKENWGAYLADCQISDTALPNALSSSEAERLWNVSEKLVNEEFAW
ncbi:related to double substrate-specificity short chain dehydrogenase/reductase 2 [Rhynchosporium agropyri]|uniref:Related to double substrate-specificity short chain dehydrogenase/reductase 2 n=1 Tax=Rhynchosporium agropyri TaxID=914238 RepID=A0A1E1L4Q4_9HELO|nr:related to double substrate-specificity short chain dehydrogenase/reductase 2 [Rhynchosporium agropyri]